jgi:alpha-tubulin suppressor-like RCC1 family protein
MSFGFSAEGMLGQAFNHTHTMEPGEVFLPCDNDSSDNSYIRIASISAGAFHVVALSQDGNAYSWGINSNDRLGLGHIDFETLADELPEKKENLVVIEWVPQKIDATHKISAAAKRCYREKKGDDADPNHRIALVCAGYDSSIMVTETGQVLSFGKRSGRLGKGEMPSNVNTPEPMYGGLHLFHPRSTDGLLKTTTTARPKRMIQRHVSLSTME